MVVRIWAKLSDHVREYFHTTYPTNFAETTTDMVHCKTLKFTFSTEDAVRPTN